MSRKIDYKKDFKELYAPSAKEPVIITVPKMNFLMVDGKGGNPATNREFQQAMEALYGMAYTIKFTLKFAKKGPDFTVPPLEGLWWTASGRPFDAKKPNDWRWRMMMTMPNHVTSSDVVKAKKELKEKKNPAALSILKFGPFTEGKVVQIMHVGPYDKEQPTLDRMHAFAQENGYTLTGKHHEIYISDPRRVAKSKIKTVLRHPVKK